MAPLRRRFARRARTDGNRRGATMVILAVVMSVLVMFSAFGLDFGRMYTFSAQLKTLTDAAALSAAVEIRNNGTEANARARALALVAANRVDGTNQATMASGDIEFGTWNINTNEFVATGTYTGATAVRATARYTARWTLAQIFGASTKALTQRSVALVGSSVATGCLKPFAFPYGSLLQTLGESPTNLNYVLTPQDIADLTVNAGIMTWSMATNGTVAATTPNGSFGLVGFEPGYTAAQNKMTYLTTIIPPGCVSGNVQVGDSLPAVTGNMLQANPIVTALEALCPRSGNGNSPQWTCSPAPRFEVPIYGTVTGSGTGGKYYVKYIGAFQLTEVDLSGSKQDLKGYLTAISSQASGSFSPYSGPSQKAALVQ